MSDPFVVLEPTHGIRSSGGQIIVPAAMPPINASFPLSFQQLLEWESFKGPLSVELQLQSQYQPPPAGQTFPDNSVSGVGELAGANDNPGLWGLNAGLVAKIELGSGPIPRTLYSDVRNGRWALGSQSRVRVSVARWIVNQSSGLQLSLQGAVAPCQGGSDADPLTFTCGREIAAGATASLVTPNGAVWFDTFVAAGSQIEITGIGGIYYKDTTLAAPICFPPATPWPLPAQGTLDFENVGAAAAQVFVTFWLR